MGTQKEVQAYFDGGLTHKERQDLVMRWCTQPYWMAPFHMALNDPFLHIMFTEKATQHAGANSYAVYFQKQILAGLLREDGNRNPF